MICSLEGVEGVLVEIEILSWISSKAKGTGKVVSQSIKGGKKVYAGQEVILNFL